jgi:hypothetical protein
MKVLKIIFKIIVYGFALIGFILMAGFFAVKYNLTTAVAVVDENSDKYQESAMEFNKSNSYNIVATSTEFSSSSSLSLNDLELKLLGLESSSAELQALKLKKLQNLCQIEAIGATAPENAKNIAMVYRNNCSDWVFRQMILALSLRLNDNWELQNRLKICNESSNFYFSESDVLHKYDNTNNSNIFGWANTESWPIITKAVLKDEVVIKKAAAELSIEPRLIVSILIVEQLRLYNTQREFYEKFFKPLEILANANKMAWGVMAIKEATAIDIERNLKNKNSSFYLGEAYEKILDFGEGDNAKARYDRLTNPKDHYYSYLYGGLLVKQLINQWSSQGYEIGNRPEVIATLFNVGFMKSSPKADPQVGGSIIGLNGVDYTFGSLAHEFYYSNLIPEFTLK